MVTGRRPLRRGGIATYGGVMHTLHHAAEIRGIEQVDELNSVTTKVKPEEVRLAKQIIESFEAPLDLATYRDEYQEGLKAIIDAKIAGQEIVAPAVEAPARVVNLMDALRKSLDAVSTTKKRTAKVEPVRSAAKAAPAKKRARA